VYYPPNTHRRRRVGRSVTAVLASATLVTTGSVAVTGAAHAATPDNRVVEVNNGDSAWAEQAYECTDTGANLTPQQESVAGPQRAPFGSGSHHIRIGEFSSQTELYRTAEYDGTPLAQLSRLEYSTHATPLQDNQPERQPTYLRLNVDNNGDNVRDASLFFFPANNAEQQPVQNGVWQNWDVGNGDISVGGDSGPGGTTTLDQYVQSHPDATLVNNDEGKVTGGALALITGCGMGGDSDPQRNGDYHVDRVVVGTDDADTLYDFEGPAETTGGTDQQTVEPGHRAPWVSQAYDYQTGNDLASNQTFVSGPGEAPSGAGSLRFTVSDNTNPNRIEQFRTEELDGRLLRDVRDLSFSTYTEPMSGNTTPQQPAYLYLRVDNNGDGEDDGVLFFYPANNAQQQPVESGTWQTWNAAEGNWNLGGDTGPANSFTLDEYLAEHPDAVIDNNGQPESSWSGGGTTFQVGAGGAGQTNGHYYVDDVTMTTADEETSSTVSGTNYDLEPTAPTAAPKVSINDAQTPEGDSSSSPASFTVSLDEKTDHEVVVDFRTSDDTATAGEDYAASTGTARIPAGSTTDTVNIPVHGDTAAEEDESFDVALSNANGATIADGSGIGTISNDDEAQQPSSNSISISNARVSEGNGGSVAESFTITMEEAQNSPTTVEYATRNGTARATSDYLAKAGTATIPADQTSTVVNVRVNGDKAHEPTEAYSVRLSNPQGSGNPELGDRTGNGTIVNDDTDVNITARDAQASNRVRAIVGTTPRAANDEVTVHRSDAGRDSVLYRGRLNDEGRLNRVLDREFPNGTTVRLYARVVPNADTGAWYQSETDPATVRR
jgi:hypothetical protein